MWFYLVRPPTSLFGEDAVLRNLITVVALAVACEMVTAAQTEGAPKEARTTADIRKWVESVKGFGIVSMAEYRTAGKQMFIIWYNPYSGRAACHVHAYVFDAKKEQWVRHLDRFFQGTHTVSVEVGAVLTIRDANGKVVYKDKPAN
jgi:hypothetical protein